MPRRPQASKTLVVKVPSETVSSLNNLSPEFRVGPEFVKKIKEELVTRKMRGDMWEQEAKKLAEDLNEANDELEKAGKMPVLRAEDMLVVEMEEDSHYAREYARTVQDQIQTNRESRRKNVKN